MNYQDAANNQIQEHERVILSSHFCSAGPNGIVLSKSAKTYTHRTGTHMGDRRRHRNILFPLKSDVHCDFFFLLFARQFNIIFFFVETKDFMDRNCWKIIVIEPNDDCAVWCQSAAATIAACLPVAVDIFCIWSPLPLHVVTLRGSMRVRETTDTHTRMTQIRMCVRGGIVLCFHPTWNGTTQWISGREGRKLARTRC